VVLKISFDYAHFLANQEIRHEPNFICLQFDGVDKAKLLGNIPAAALVFEELGSNG
jgi:hypothetical protein